MLATVAERLSTFNCVPALFHVHYTVRSGTQGKSLHKIFLPPDYIQTQTVVKCAKFCQLEAATNGLEPMGEAIIGRKIEALFRREELIKALEIGLPIFNYVEIHGLYDLHDKENTYPKNTYLSYSFKHGAIVTAIRFYMTDVADAIEYLKRSEAVNVEVSLYDSWVDDDIEAKWIELMNKRSLAEVQTIIEIEFLRSCQKLKTYFVNN